MFPFAGAQCKFFSPSYQDKAAPKDGKGCLWTSAAILAIESLVQQQRKRLASPIPVGHPFSDGLDVAGMADPSPHHSRTPEFAIRNAPPTTHLSGRVSIADGGPLPRIIRPPANGGFIYLATRLYFYSYHMRRYVHLVSVLNVGNDDLCR